LTDHQLGTKERIRGEWWVLTAAILWGTTGTAQAFGPETAQPAAIGALRLLFGGLALLLFAIIRGSFQPRQPWPVRWILIAAGCIAGYQLLFFASVRMTGVAIGTLVAIGSAPILAGILAKIFQHEILSRRWFISTALAVTGCMLLIGSMNDEGDLHLTGLILALGAGLAYAGYSVTTKRILEHQAPEAVISVIFTLGALLLSPILFFYNLNWLAYQNGIIIILHLGLIATAFAYILFARGLKLLPVSTAVTLSLAEPLTAASLGIFILHESVTWEFLIGMLVLFVGLAVLAVNRSLPLTRCTTPQ
jgi:DME family drug/metabolite transporter